MVHDSRQTKLDVVDRSFVDYDDVAVVVAAVAAYYVAVDHCPTSVPIAIVQEAVRQMRPNYSIFVG